MISLSAGVRNLNVMFSDVIAITVSEPRCTNAGGGTANIGGRLKIRYRQRQCGRFGAEYSCGKSGWTEAAIGNGITPRKLLRTDMTMGI